METQEIQKYMDTKLQDLDNKLEFYHINGTQGDLVDVNKKLTELNTKTTAINTSLSDYKSVTDSNINSINVKIKNINTNLSTYGKTLSQLADENYDLNEKANTINDNVTLNTAKIETLTTNFSAIDSKVSQNTEKINQNEENISQLQTNVSTINENMSQLQNDINSTNENVSQLQQSVSDLENGDTSGGTDLVLVEKVNKIENITNKFITLIKDRNAVVNTPYEDIDQDTVVQTYDYADRLYNFSGNGEYHSGEFYFSVSKDSNAHFKITLHITSSSTGTGTLKIYYNEDNITDTLSFNYDTNTTFVEFDFDKPVLANGNLIYFKVCGNGNINFTYAKVEVSCCTNPVMYNKARKFDVMYALNKYYVSDCSSGTLKIASIDVNEITSVNDLQWTDTGYDARESAFTITATGNQDPYTPTGINYACIGKDNNITFYNPTANTIIHIYSAIATKISYSFKHSTDVSYYSTAINRDLHRKMMYYTENGSSYYMEFMNNTTQYAYMLNMKRNVDNLKSNAYCYIRCKQNTNGDIELDALNDSINLGKGQLLEFYSSGIFPLTFIVIAKMFNKIVKFVINEDTKSKVTITSKNVVGYYDYYFEGANNDYFVVKNNKLYYYKESLQDIDTTTDDNQI